MSVSASEVTDNESDEEKTQIEVDTDNGCIDEENKIRKSAMEVTAVEVDEEEGPICSPPCSLDDEVSSITITSPAPVLELASQFAWSKGNKPVNIEKQLKIQQLLKNHLGLMMMNSFV